MNLNASLEKHLELVVCSGMHHDVTFMSPCPISKRLSKTPIFFAAWRKKVSMSSGYTKRSKIWSWRKGTSNNFGGFFHKKKLGSNKKIRRTSRINHSYKSVLKYLICFCNEIITLAKQIWGGFSRLQKISESSFWGKPKTSRKKRLLEMQHDWSKRVPKAQRWVAPLRAARSLSQRFSIEMPCAGLFQGWTATLKGRTTLTKSDF